MKKTKKEDVKSTRWLPEWTAHRFEQKYVSPQQGCVFGSRLIVECKDRRRKHAKYQLMRAVAQSA